MDAALALARFLILLLTVMFLDLVLAKNGASTRSLVAASARKAAAAQKRTQPLKVLVVDDEPLIRWSLRRGLTRNGHGVHEATSAAETLAAIAINGPFDAVVLDYRLPDRRDLSLLRQVRHGNPEAIVVMMTAYGEPGMRDEALALGAAAVVDKPFQVAELVHLIETA